MEENNTFLKSLIGTNPRGQFARLLLASVIVGFILAKIDLHPYEIFEFFQRKITALFDMGFEAVVVVLKYVFWGAAVVVPIWLLMRLFKMLVAEKR